MPNGRNRFASDSDETRRESKTPLSTLGILAAWIVLGIIVAAFWLLLCAMAWLVS